MSRYLGAAPGFVVAVDLAPGPAWVDVVADLWGSGAAILPLDARLTDRERRAIVDLARPASLVTADDEVMFADAVATEVGRVALVMATSGTEGGAKLVELSRGAVTAAVRLSSAALASEEPAEGAAERSAVLAPSPEPWVCCLSPAHIGGMLVLLRHVVSGAPVTVLDRLGIDPTDDVPDGARISLVPTMLRRLVDAEADLSRFGVLLVGGGNVDADLAERAARLGGRVVTTYGLTETSGGIAYDGQTFEGVRVRFASGGEIEVRGPTLMEGYRHAPASTAAAFTLDGWLRTGDAGALDDDGRLRVDGRLDDAIRTGAETVWPREVERALEDHPKVADVAVAGRPHDEWGRQVVAFVVPRLIDDPPTLSDVRAHVADRIARFKAPKALVLVSEIPRTASGKIRRGALPS